MFKILDQKKKKTKNKKYRCIVLLESSRKKKSTIILHHFLWVYLRGTIRSRSFMRKRLVRFPVRHPKAKWIRWTSGWVVRNAIDTSRTLACVKSLLLLHAGMQYHRSNKMRKSIKLPGGQCGSQYLDPGSGFKNSSNWFLVFLFSETFMKNSSLTWPSSINQSRIFATVIRSRRLTIKSINFVLSASDNFGNLNCYKQTTTTKNEEFWTNNDVKSWKQNLQTRLKS